MKGILEGKAKMSSQFQHYQFQFDPETDRQISLAWQILLESREDWKIQPGYVFQSERSSWLACSATRIGALQHDTRWHGSKWKRAMETRLWQEGLLTDCRYFAVEGILTEIQAQIRQLQLLGAGDSDEEIALDHPLSVINTHQLGSADINLAYFQTRVLARIEQAATQRDAALQALKKSPLTSSASSFKFWRPLGVAAILERERLALARYLLWLKDTQADLWLVQVQRQMSQPHQQPSEGGK